MSLRYSLRISGKWPRGFTLVEVAIAMGILSFALVSVLGLLGVALDTNRRAIETTREAQIVRRIVANARTLSWRHGDGTDDRFDSPQKVFHFDYEGEEVSDGSSPHFVAVLSSADVSWPGGEVPAAGSLVTLRIEIVSRTNPAQPDVYSATIANKRL